MTDRRHLHLIHSADEPDEDGWNWVLLGVLAGCVVLWSVAIALLVVALT